MVRKMAWFLVLVVQMLMSVITAKHWSYCINRVSIFYLLDRSVKMYLCFMCDLYGSPLSEAAMSALLQCTKRAAFQGGFCWGRWNVIWKPNLAKFLLHTRETAVSELLIKTLTPPLDSVTPIAYMVRIFWRSVDIYHVTLIFDHLILTVWHV